MWDSDLHTVIQVNHCCGITSAVLRVVAPASVLTAINALAISLFKSILSRHDGSEDSFNVDYCSNPVAAHIFKK